MALAGAVFAATVRFAVPADAHSCAASAEVQVGTIVSFVVPIPSGGPTAVIAVDVVVPPAFHLADRPVEEAVTVSHDAGELHVSGLRISPGSCGQITLRGTASQPGTLLLPLKTRTEDGTVALLDSVEPFDPKAAMVVIAQGSVRSQDGLSPLTMVTMTVGAVGVLALTVRVRGGKHRARADR